MTGSSALRSRKCREPRREDGLLYAAGRTLQLVGLVMTGIGLIQGVVGGNIRQELALLALGAAVFFAGRLVQGARK